MKVQPNVVARSPMTSDEWERAVRYRITRGDGTAETIVIEKNPTFWHTEMRYTLTNASSRPVVVTVAQNGLDGYYRDTRLLEESIAGKQRNADTRVWEVPVPANGEIVLSATFATRY